MKKNFKRTLAKVMAVALTVALAGTAAPEADAAKKIKLSNKSITVTKGKTKKVTIKNVKAKKVKKLTVKSNKTKIATVKKSGKTAFKVTGKKAGSAKITATVKVKGQKKATKLTLKVTVKKAVPPTPTTAPTTAPTAAPTATASAAPTASASAAPSAAPSAVPSATPSAAPSTAPSTAPTEAPKLETKDIVNLQLGGVDAEKVTLFESKDGVTDVILNSNAQYGNVFTYFDVVLPEGASVSDIKKITYDIEGVSGDLSNKFNSLLVGSPDPDDAAVFPIDSYINFDWDEKAFMNALEVYRSVTYDSSFDGATVSEEAVFDDDTVAFIDDQGITGNTLRFSIFANLAGNPTEYKISNIKVYTTEGVTVTEGFDKPGDTIDTTAAAEPEGVIALGKGSVAVGETTSAEFSLSNAVLVGNVDTIDWSIAGQDVIDLSVDEENPAKAEITAKAAGVETISVEVTTTKGKTATITKTITVTEEAVEIEDVVLELTENNVVTIASGTGAYSGGSTIDISDLIKNVDLSNYKEITVYGSITYGDEEIDDFGVAQTALLTGDSWTADSAASAYNVRNSKLQEGFTYFGEKDLATALTGKTTLKVLYQNSIALEKDLVITVTKVVLNAKD